MLRLGDTKVLNGFEVVTMADCPGNQGPKRGAGAAVPQTAEYRGTAEFCRDRHLEPGMVDGKVRSLTNQFR